MLIYICQILSTIKLEYICRGTFFFIFCAERYFAVVAALESPLMASMIASSVTCTVTFFSARACSTMWRAEGRPSRWNWNGCGKSLPCFDGIKVATLGLLDYTPEEEETRRRWRRRVYEHTMPVHFTLRRWLRGGVNRWVYFSYRRRFYRLIFPIILSFSVSPDYYEGQDHFGILR